MAAADLQGPLDDFIGRIFHIRAAMVAIESAAKSPGTLTTARSEVDLSKIGLQTGNTVNAMALIFLASSFEEFVREEIVQCAGYLSERYAHLNDDVRHGIRNAYWGAALDKLRFNSSILTKRKPKVPDVNVIGKARALLDSLQGFAISDDASKLEGSLFGQHSNNFRPHVVNEIAHRLGIKEILLSVAENTKIKSYFGVTVKSIAAERLKAKLDEFYDRRNEIVHSLTGNTGYAVDVVMDYIKMFELTAESMTNVLTKELASW
ncbi:HEPN domain-containing protein [Cupriavidus sp. UME77]|uniref:HEPN domain-containing protein n=1 Tax=Cupriavidus sp. UME77 TaxID=1862321 RepID=UPI0016029C30|nr:HEPN domain-containing protein [Cupriavidus sp. UME77]